eukprot:CFRG0660T1
MGLLGDLVRKKKLVCLLFRHHTLLSLICYVVGIAWFFQLRLPHNIGREYISENALLPGVANVRFGKYNDAPKVEFMYQKLTKALLRDDIHRSESPPIDFVTSMLKPYGLEVYSQDFNVSYLVGSASYPKTVTGTNVFAIMRPARADGKEALLLNIPYGLSYGERNDHGLALAMTLMIFFQNQKYLSRDIVLLVSDQGYSGMEAWLDGYHSSPIRTSATNRVISYDPVRVRAGQLIAGLSIELYSNKISTIDVRYEGTNGQLSNLDLIYSIVRIGRSLNIPVNIRDSEGTSLSDPVQTQILPYTNAYTRGYPEVRYWVTHLAESVDTVWDIIRYQLTGLPTGAHGLLFRYNIAAAVTVKGYYHPSMGQKIFIDTVGRLVESIFHSLSNLLERFHQSFFFFLTVGNTSYISIGLYLPPLGVSCAGLLLTAIFLWIGTGDWLHSYSDKCPDLALLSSLNMAPQTSNSVHEQESKKGGNTDIIENFEVVKEPETANKRGCVFSMINEASTTKATAMNSLTSSTAPEMYFPRSGLAFSLRQRQIDGAMRMLATAICTSGMSIIVPVVGLRVGLVQTNDNTFTMALMLSIGLIVLLGPFVILPTNQSVKVITSSIPFTPVSSPAPQWMLVKCFMCLYTAISVASIALMNFSLALALAVVLVPPCLLVRPTPKSLATPFFWVYFVSISPVTIISMIALSINACPTDVIARTIQLYQLISLWTLPVVGMTVLPICLLLQSILFAIE